MKDDDETVQLNWKLECPDRQNENGNSMQTRQSIILKPELLIPTFKQTRNTPKASPFTSTNSNSNCKEKREKISIKIWNPLLPKNAKPTLGQIN